MVWVDLVGCLCFVIYFGLKSVDPVCSIIKTKGTKLVHSETSRTQTVIFTKITSKGFMWHFLDIWKAWVVILPKYLHKDQKWILESLRDQKWTFFKLYFRVSYGILAILRTSCDHKNFHKTTSFPGSGFISSFPNLVPVLSFSRDFSSFLKYPYLHIHKHKNTLSLALLVSFWFIWSNFG